VLGADLSAGVLIGRSADIGRRADTTTHLISQTSDMTCGVVGLAD
jgi:hypothetical protein